MTDLEKAEGQFLESLEEYVRYRIRCYEKDLTDDEQKILNVKLNNTRIDAKYYGHEYTIKVWAKQTKKQEAKDADWTPQNKED